MHQEVSIELLRDVVAFDRGPVEVLMEHAPMTSPPGPVSLKRMAPIEVGTVTANDEEDRNSQS